MGAIKHHRPLPLLLLVVLFFSAAPLAAATRTEVTILLSHEAARPGETITAGIRLRAPAGWHTYWKYAGDSGEPTSVAWTLPSSLTASELLWPLPEKLIEVGFSTYIYEGEVILLAPITIAAGAPAGSAALRAKVAWQECEKVCVMGQTEVTANLVIGTESRPSANAALLASWRDRVPMPQPTLKVAADWEKPATENPRPLTIAWPAAAGAKILDEVIPHRRCHLLVVRGGFEVAGDMAAVAA